MKFAQRHKRAVSLLLTVLMILSTFTAAIVSFSAATATISYSYTGSGSAKAGYAQGTITLSAPAGKYWLYWADDTKALDGYYQLAALTVGSSGTVSHTMYAQTAIPADATKLIAIQSTNEPSDKFVANASAVYTIPESKLIGHKTSERKYRFASYSDIHIDGLYSTYKYHDVHLRKAFDTAAARDADFIVMTGDYVNNNVDFATVSDEEWRIYTRVLAESDYCNPVYEAIGNHELWQDVSKGTADFIKATGLDGSKSSDSKAYFEKTLGGDHFIFMSLEGGFYPDRVEEFSTAQLDWLEGLLKKYSGDGKNIYIIEHSLFYKYGAGDRVTGNPYYDIPLSDNQASTVRFKKLLQTYKDTIFISGHTHIAFEYQYNYSDNSGTSAQMIHNSSVGGVRYIGSDGTLTRNYPEDEEEGYIVDVFDNAIIFNGTHLYYNMIDPNCCYIVKTSKEVYEGQGNESTQPNTSQGSTSSQSPTSSQIPTYNPDIPTTISTSNYYLKGSFNSWSNGNPFYNSSESGILSTTLNLSAGTYTFKINTSSTWYGNDGTIEDTTRATSKGGWEMTTSAGDCTLKASGGYYTFNFNTTNNKLTIIYSTSDPYYVEPTEAATTVAPTTAAPTTAAPTTEQPTTEEPSTAPTKSEYRLGDVDEDGMITIKDATEIQKYVAKFNGLIFSTAQIYAADVNFDTLINIKDVTEIQKYIAHMISEFSPETAVSAVSKLAEPVGASDVQTQVANNLSLYYRYSSYDCYQALKKAYRSGTASDSELISLQNALLAVVDTSNIDTASRPVTVYFENTNEWSSVYAYVWGNGGVGSEKAWPGYAATYVGKNEYGKKIYKYTINSDKFTSVIFNNGTSQTRDLRIYDKNICYYISGGSSPYDVKSYVFKDKYIVSK